jgi:hypothetical protein
MVGNSMGEGFVGAALAFSPLYELAQSCSAAALHRCEKTEWFLMLQQVNFYTSFTVFFSWAIST